MRKPIQTANDENNMALGLAKANKFALLLIFSTFPITKQHKLAHQTHYMRRETQEINTMDGWIEKNVSIRYVRHTYYIYVVSRTQRNQYSVFGSRNVGGPILSVGLGTASTSADRHPHMLYRKIESIYIFFLGRKEEDI